MSAILTLMALPIFSVGAALIFWAVIYGLDAYNRSNPKGE